MQDLSIKIIQSNLIWEDKAANFDHFENVFFKKIKKSSVDLVLLPEMFNTGFSMDVVSMGETMEGESVAWLKKWATELDTTIGGSLIIQENGNYVNRFVIVSSKGIQTNYDKRHLFRMAEEQNHFTAGDKRVIFELKGWKLMLQVCYDLRFPVFSRNRIIDNEKEYDALIYIANWPEKRAFIWKNLIQARAIENQAFCIGVNRVGKDGNEINYSGDSLFVDPWGNLQCQIEPRIEKMETLVLTRKTLTEIQTNFPAFLDSDSFSLLP